MSGATAAELPKQDLLAKLLAMTTSPNDGEALCAMRKANALLLAAGWTWERLIQGKIRVLEDPFKSIVEPAIRPAEEMKRATTPAQQQPYSYNPAPRRPRAPYNPAKRRVPKTTLADLGLDA
jgi:hypothetical protein